MGRSVLGLQKRICFLHLSYCGQMKQLNQQLLKKLPLCAAESATQVVSRRNHLGPCREG